MMLGPLRLRDSVAMFVGGLQEEIGYAISDLGFWIFRLGLRIARCSRG